MDNILADIRQGKFQINGNTIELESGIVIWAANGWLSYGFYPSLNTAFTISEKWRMRSAVKAGVIAKAERYAAAVSLSSMIDDFERQCEVEEHTDTDRAWRLLNLARIQLASYGR